MNPPPKPDVKSISFARQALSTMVERNIDPNPINYAIWYHYAVGDKGDLNKELDLLIKRKTPPTDDVAIYLYNRYVLATIKKEEQAVEHASQNTQSVLAEIMNVIDRFSDDTQNYNEQIDEHVSKLSEKITDPTLKEMAREIVARATAIRETSSALTNKLEASRKEVVQLKTSLEKVQVESNRDFLTGCSNRKAFEGRIDELTSAVKVMGGDLSLLMLDVDHFKKFNDTFGHLIGDEVLKKVGRALMESIKKTDFVYRYGGEEFAVLLPNTNLADALMAAENIRKNISETELVRKDNGKSLGTINVSIGVARFRPDMDTVPLLISRADAALYRSKMGGRNRVTPESFEPA